MPRRRPWLDPLADRLHTKTSTIRTKEAFTRPTRPVSYYYCKNICDEEEEGGGGGGGGPAFVGIVLVLLVVLLMVTVMVMAMAMLCVFLERTIGRVCGGGLLV